MSKLFNSLNFVDKQGNGEHGYKSGWVKYLLRVVGVISFFFGRASESKFDGIFKKGLRTDRLLIFLVIPILHL